MTSKRKKLLWILLPAAVVGIAAVVAAVVLLTGDGKAHFRDISKIDPGEAPVLLVENGPGDTPSPFPRYPIAAPEDYTQTQDSSLVANRFSQEYLDRFYTQGGHWVSFTQTPVRDHDRITLPVLGEYEILQFGGREVVYYQGEDWQDQPYVGLKWMVGSTLFTVTSDLIWERDQALAWVTWVEDQQPLVPEISPLSILPGKVWTFPGENGPVTDRRDWQVVGNPELPEQQSSHRFLTPPQGFTGGSAGWSEQGEVWAYQNQAGDGISLTNPTISNYSAALFRLSDQELGDPNSVQQVKVNGCAGVMHLGQEESTLVWLVGDGYITLNYDGNITADELLALGEQVN